MDRTRRSMRGRRSTTGEVGSRSVAIHERTYDGTELDNTMVDLSVLDANSLKKYKRVFRLRTRNNNATKAEMLQAVARHFNGWPAPSEEETIEYFIYNIKYSN